MEIKKTGKINIAASGLALLMTIYIGVIYILLMIGDTPNSIAYEIGTDYVGNWVFPFILCIFMYLACLANVLALPTYYALKSKNSSSPVKKASVIAQIFSSVVILLVVILFWSWQGGIWYGDIGTPFATPYRIIELIFAIVQVGLVILTILYSPRTDTVRQLKNRKKKKA